MAQSPLLPLVKRTALLQTTERSRRERMRAAPAAQQGQSRLKLADFEVGCEVLVPRQHTNGRTFTTWCSVRSINPAGALIVDVPMEAPQPISLSALQRLAEIENNGPAGALLAENRRLRREHARLEEALRAEQLARRALAEQLSMLQSRSRKPSTS